MTVIFAKSARLSSGWARDVRLTISQGRIDQITPLARAGDNDSCVDTLLPALANLHSHSFQRAMAGMSEYRSANGDDFWSWRKLMYQFLEHLTPARIEAIASLVFMEMQEAGYASVGEFHYLHHQPGGQTYDRLAETSEQIFTAAEATGIGLTHLPVLYSYGGVGKADLSGGQLRFGNDVERFNQLVGQASAGLKYLPDDARLGIAPHSLRAISPPDLSAVLEVQTSGPVHIHIAEQTQEVLDINNWLKARPVAWLLDNAPVDQRWCLVHATHMNETETVALAKSGAVAGLCPITEANLGDGPFNGPLYLENGGVFGIGSDSNVRIALGEELRLLEYSQRLRDQTRNVMVAGAGALGGLVGGSVGESLYLGAARGGAQALDRKAGVIEVGALADLVAINRDDPALCALSDQQVLDGLVFAAGPGVISDVWSAGRHKVRDGRHIARNKIQSNYRRVVAEIISEL